MDFDYAYSGFIKFHTTHRTGPGALRISAGLEHAEKLFLENVWWHAFHHFDSLHPQYEIQDFKDGYRYIDFAYIQPYYRIAIEIDGIGSHWKDISQTQFSDHCQRQNHLVIDGWYVLRFTFHDVHEHPRLCRQTIQQLLGRLMGIPNTMMQQLRVTDREIIRLSMTSHRPITVRDVVIHTRLGSKAAKQHLKRLTDMKWLEPASGSIRIRSYRLHQSRTNIQM